MMMDECAHGTCVGMATRACRCLLRAQWMTMAPWMAKQGRALKEMFIFFSKWGENTQNSTLSDRNFDFCSKTVVYVENRLSIQIQKQNRKLAQRKPSPCKITFCFHNYSHARMRSYMTPLLVCVMCGSFLIILRTILPTEQYFLN